MAQVGRISGPLLFSNLERNGKDIDFRNQQASVPTLKLDVNNNYIGINKTAPAFALDIGGTATLNFSDIKLTSLTPGNFSISNDDITVFSGDINFTNPVVQSENRTLQTRITQNRIDTYVTNASLHLSPNGTGTIELLTDTNVDGALHATGDITLEGNIVLGDSSAEDTITFNADVNSNVIPDAHYTYDLGTDKRTYNNLWAHYINGIIANSNALTLNNINITNVVGNIFWVSPNGDDTNKGDHPQSPWRTLSHALSAADSSVGGPVVIHLESGEYEETFPLTVPEQVSVYGEDMRNVIITPTTGTESENAFLLNDSSTIQNITIKDFYYDSANDKGYAFAFAPNASISSRSPYVFNTTVITKGTPITVTASTTHSIAGEEAGARGITFNNDGTKMFIAGQVGDDISEYTLSVGFDLSSTVTYVDSFSVIANPTAVKFNLDGTKMYVTSTSNRLAEYNLSTAFDVSSATFNQFSPYWSSLVTPTEGDTFGFDFNNDGTKLYVTGNQRDKIYEFDLPGAFDISSLTFVQDLYVGNIDIEPFGIEFNTDGTRMFIVGTRGNGVDEFKLSTGFDISTATHVGFYHVGGNPSGIHISPDGTKMFIVGNVSDSVKSYDLSVSYRISQGDDARGYDLADAGRAVKCDGAVVDTNSPNASMLFYSLTCITPGTTAVKVTNGVRVEWLNSFVYFAKEGIRVENGSTGRLTSDGSTIDYGGEMRCINSANIYGEKGIIADGSDALVYIVEHTFSYAGTGKRSDNDTSFVTEKFETTELNNGKILGTFVDKDGDFNVGDVLYVNQETGDVEFKSVDFDFSDIAALTINTDGSVVTIDGTKVQTDLIRFRNNIVESTAGPLNFDAAPQMVININDNVTINANLDVSGNLTIGGALVRLGDADTDSIDFNAEVDNNFIPNLNNTYTLGTTSKYWHWLYSSILDTGDIVLETNKIRTTASNSDLELSASGTGSVVIPRLRAGQTATITGTSTFNTTVDMQSTIAVTGNIDINGNASFNNLTTDNLSANSNVTIGDVHFVGNRITTLDTDSNLELRPSGTGLFKIVGDLVIENRLVAPGADYTLVDATMDETSAGHLVVQSDLTIQGMSINESFNISGNVIESNVTNADAELRATGTGNVVFQENLQVDNNVSVGGNMVLDVVTLNNLTAGDITTDTADVPSFDFDNIEFTGNFITTTLTNSDLELRANGTGVVRVDNATNLEDNLTVKGTSTIKNATARTFTAQNLIVNENITMPSNMTLEGVDFIGNTITSNRTNSDLDLRASGTGVVRFPTNNVVITNDLTVNGDTTFGSISSTNARPNTLIVNRLDAFGTQFEDVNITGNKITTTLTNSNLELGAGGTGVVRFTEAVSVPNLTVNDTLTVEGITVNADVEFDEIETSGDILFNDNYITTTESNSDLELRGNADGRIRLNDVEFKGDTLYADRADSTISTLELRADKFVIDSTDSLTLPKGTISANEDSTSTADIRYDTSINQFVGKRGGFQAVFGGIYSNNLQTRVRIDSNNNAIFFDVNGTNVMEMNSIGETYAHRIELSGSDSTPGGIDIDDNVISTNWTNADLTLLPEGGTGRTNIEDLQILDKTIYTTGTNIGTLAATGKGYIKFDQDNGLRIPIGTSAEREPNPEVGSSRFNTDLAYLENYTAGGWVTAAGTGAGVSENEMNEIMNEFILIFG